MHTNGLGRNNGEECFVVPEILGRASLERIEH